MAWRILVCVLLLAGVARAEGPLLGSPSAIALDATTGEVLFERRADELRPIASMTKLFAALVLRARGLELARVTRITHDDVRAGAGGAPTMLREGERFANRELLLAMLLSSDNRTPTALARSVGMTPDELLAAMQRRAADLGLANTRLADVTGLAGNASTAREMALALRDAIRDPVLRRAMTTRRAHVTSESGDVVGDYTSTLPALWTDRTILGGKTGWTEAAGYCQVVAIQLGSRRIVMAFLGAPTNSRLDDFVALVDFIASRDPGRAPASPRPASARR